MPSDGSQMRSIAERRSLRKLVLVVGAAVALAIGGGGPAWADDDNDGGQNNYAIAENHRDYSTMIRTSLKVVYVTGDVTALNAADAEASCAYCRTAAVAIEAIIVEGYPKVYAPQNYAIALNTNCSFCDTAAYAGQFDLQYAGQVELTKAGEHQVRALQHQLRALEHSGQSAVAIVQLAKGIRAQLETVLKNNLVPADGEDAGEQEHDRESLQAA
jgi:hypothetical protein